MNRGRVERDPKPPTCAPPSFGPRKNLDVTALVNAGAVHFWGSASAALPAEAGTRALLVAARSRISGSAAGPIAVLDVVLDVVLTGRPPALESGPIECSVPGPDEDLVPGSRHVGTVEGVFTEPPDEGSEFAGFQTCGRRIEKNGEPKRCR
jgi:hypothetical protein